LSTTGAGTADGAAASADDIEIRDPITVIATTAIINATAMRATDLSISVLNGEAYIY
jgi:hypothetical protein